MAKEKVTKEEDAKSKRFTDAQTEKRIYEHLTNEDDLISDADIKNVKTSVVEEDTISSNEKDS